MKTINTDIFVCIALFPCFEIFYIWFTSLSFLPYGVGFSLLKVIHVHCNVMWLYLFHMLCDLIFTDSCTCITGYHTTSLLTYACTCTNAHVYTIKEHKKSIYSVTMFHWALISWKSGQKTDTQVDIYLIHVPKILFKWRQELRVKFYASLGTMQVLKLHNMKQQKMISVDILVSVLFIH